MKINVYYGGRGLLDDPTLYVLNKMEDVLKELKWYVVTPIIVLVVLFVLQSVLPHIVGLWGTPLLFVLSFIPSIFIGRKKNALEVVKNGIGKSNRNVALFRNIKKSITNKLQYCSEFTISEKF